MNEFEEEGDRVCDGLAVKVADTDDEREFAGDAEKLLEKQALGLKLAECVAERDWDGLAVYEPVKVGDRVCDGDGVNVADTDAERDTAGDAEKLLEWQALGLKLAECVGERD